MHLEELVEVARERDVLASLLKLLPHDLDPDKQKKTKTVDSVSIWIGDIYYI